MARWLGPVCLRACPAAARLPACYSPSLLLRARRVLHQQTVDPSTTPALFCPSPVVNLPHYFLRVLRRHPSRVACETITGNNTLQLASRSYTTPCPPPPPPLAVQASILRDMRDKNIVQLVGICMGSEEEGQPDDAMMVGLGQPGCLGCGCGGRRQRAAREGNPRTHKVCIERCWAISLRRQAGRHALLHDCQVPVCLCACPADPGVYGGGGPVPRAALARPGWPAGLWLVSRAAECAGAAGAVGAAQAVGAAEAVEAVEAVEGTLQLHQMLDYL